MSDGMVQRPSRKGYWSDFRAGGRRVRKFLSTNFEAACRILNQLRARADQADFGLLDNDCRITELRAAYEHNIGQTLKPGSVSRRPLDTRRETTVYETHVTCAAEPLDVDVPAPSNRVVLNVHHDRNLLSTVN